MTTDLNDWLNAAADELGISRFRVARMLELAVKLVVAFVLVGAYVVFVAPAAVGTGDAAASR